MSDYICEEMVGEIFLRLPLKTLLRFRSLSKSWCSHISTPDFKRKHILHSVGKPHKILIRHVFNESDDKSKDVYTLHSEDQIRLHTECVMSITALDFPMGKIVGSCNGLLCLLDYMTGISIWNPSLRRLLILPYHPSLRAFNVPVGFGFDPITNDYKIVAIMHKHVKSALVCSMKTSTWCEIAFPTTPFGNMSACACLVNGVLHWVVSCRSDDGIEARHYIITFNLSTNVFGKMSLPEPSCNRRHLTVISGSLAVIANEYYGHTVHVWKEYNNTAYWSLVFQLRDFPKAVENVLQVTINGDLLLYVEKEDYKAYNLKTGVCSIVAKFKASCGVDMITYGESLELLDYTNSNCYRQKICAETNIHQVQPSI